VISRLHSIIPRGLVCRGSAQIAILHYPLDGLTFVWGAVLGIVAVYR